MKEVERQLIELRKLNIHTVQEIADLIGMSRAYVQAKSTEFMRLGLIEPFSKGRKKKSKEERISYPKDTPEATMKKPKNMRCLCEYPNCTLVARFTFSFVPLCTGHYGILTEETEFYYLDDGKRQNRKHWDKISKRSAELWASQKANTFIQIKNYQKS